MKTAIELITEERKRQIEKEGWSHGHDDLHVSMDLAVAGAAYALNCAGEHTDQSECWKKYYLDGCQQFWPFDTEDFFKPTPDDPIRQLTKAAALIVAEIERIQRSEENYLNWKSEIRDICASEYLVINKGDDNKNSFKKWPIAQDFVNKNAIPW